jgi:hypothetical protein
MHLATFLMIDGFVVFMVMNYGWVMGYGALVHGLD